MENNSYHLTDEEQKEISSALESESESNIIDFPGKIESPEDNKGEFKTANISINPDTGERMVESISEIENKSEDDVFADFGSSVDLDFNTDYNIEKEDVIKAAKEQAIDEEGFTISDETALEFVSLLNRYKETNKVTYKELPAEARTYIDKYLNENSIIGLNREYNTIRNNLADVLVGGMQANIELEKFNNEFQNKIETMFDDLNNQLSPIFMDYNNSREEILRKMQDNVEDPEKKEMIENILDTIHITFTCEKLIEAAPKTKIKNYNLEKPEKVFKDVHVKYEGSKFNIYDLRLACNILDKHLKQNNYIPADDKYTAIKVLLIFAKYVSNYSISDPINHTFIYYSLYNIILLEVYKDEEYEKYSKEFLPNIMKIVGNMKK